MTLQQVLEEAKRLPDSEKWQLVRHLLDDLEAEKQPVARADWTTFVDQMYGALADDPLERPEQWSLTERDEIE